MLEGLRFQPQLAQLGLLPGMATEAVGVQRQGMAQAQLAEQAQRFIAEQIIPFMAAQEVAGLAFGIPGGTATTTGTSFVPQQQTNPLQYLLAALSLAGMFVR
jgi:hypothetical protein